MGTSNWKILETLSGTCIRNLHLEPVPGTCCWNLKPYVWGPKFLAGNKWIHWLRKGWIHLPSASFVRDCFAQGVLIRIWNKFPATAPGHHPESLAARGLFKLEYVELQQFDWAPGIRDNGLSSNTPDGPTVSIDDSILWNSNIQLVKTYQKQAHEPPVGVW